MTTTRELELLRRAEAAERAVIECTRQRDMLLSALDEIVAERNNEFHHETGGILYARTLLDVLGEQRL